MSKFFDFCTPPAAEAPPCPTYHHQTELFSKEIESDDNVESASNKETVANIVYKSTQNVVFNPDIENEPNIEFYNTLEVPNEEDELIGIHQNYLLLVM